MHLVYPSLYPRSGSLVGYTPRKYSWGSFQKRLSMTGSRMQSDSKPGGMATISGFVIGAGISILGGFCDTASVGSLGLFT